MEKFKWFVEELRTRQDCSPLTKQLSLDFMRAQYDALRKATPPPKPEER